MNLSSENLVEPSPAVVRTFRAPDARSALTAVKAAFGADAVILDTRQIGGGLFSRPQIEVTAAPPAVPARTADDREASKSPWARYRSEPRSGAARRLGDLREPGASASAAARGEIGGDQFAGFRRERLEGRPHGHGTPGRDGDSALSQGRGGAWRDGDVELGATARRVFKHLLDRGVDADHARQLVDDAGAEGARTAADLFAAVGQRLRTTLRAAPAPWGREGRRTIALIGPTGVGKTTAIAKIAARALLETGFKVGLVTVDTYRVGASDQLARYGRIMGLPTHVARNQAELATAIDRCRDADLILIDTAGRSDPQSRSAQVDLVRTAPQVQLHLVMSVAAGGRELAAVARRYKAFGAERLIFTKLDEAEAPAGVLAAAAVVPRPISCICDGQRVPEDIHTVTEESLVERLLDIPADGGAYGPSR